MKAIPKISVAEWNIMRVLWEQSPQTAGEVITLLKAEGPDWHPKTIKTLLSRLVKKGALSYEVEGRSYLYTPLVSEDECVRSASDSFLEQVFDNSVGSLMVHFAKSKKLSKSEIDELKKILKENKK